MNTSAKLTALENVVFQVVAKRNIDFLGEDYSELDVNELVKETNIDSKVLRGVLSSLVKKEVVEIQDNETYQMISLFDQENVTEEEIETLIANN